MGDDATTYEIRLAGPTTKDVLHTYEGVHVTIHDDGLTMCARLPDQAALHGVLVEARLLGLEVVGLRMLRPCAPARRTS